MIQMLTYHQSTKPECYLEKAKEIIMTIFILDSVIGFYLICHDIKKSQLRVTAPEKAFVHYKGVYFIPICTRAWNCSESQACMCILYTLRPSHPPFMVSI